MNNCLYIDDGIGISAMQVRPTLEKSAERLTFMNTVKAANANGSIITNKSQKDNIYVIAKPTYSIQF